MLTFRHVRTTLMLLGTLTAVAAAAAPPPSPVVEAEEVVYTFTNANNGAGPTWCHGNTSLVRCGDALLASGIETLADVKPYNNVRWMLFARTEKGWELQQADPIGRTREPCPLVAFPDGRVLLSVNPTLAPRGAEGGGPARPAVLQFQAADPKAPPQELLPTWDGQPQFTEHSYRSFVADAPNRELILFNKIGYTHAEWSFLDRSGQWSACGKLKWPWGAEYDTPEPVRVCYPAVALKNRAVYFCGVSDVVEPYQVWRAYKKQLTGQEWDYDFRRLFFTWCPDITTGKFSEWVEVASRDKTCGWIFPCDLWVAPDGAAHILWTERALDERLRAKFFPKEKQTYALNYAVLREGKVAFRRTLLLGGEGASAETPGEGRFQVTPDNRLFVFYYVSGRDPKGRRISENRLMELYPDGTGSGQIRVPLAHPVTSFFTATVRGGSPPSNVLEAFGPRADQGNAMCYARVRLF
jgi:hypothetical protein